MEAAAAVAESSSKTFRSSDAEVAGTENMPFVVAAVALVETLCLVL